MKTTNHTPGPWKLDAGRMIRTVSGDFYLSYKTDKATSAPAFQNFSELDANAHLISAAPDLLSALEAIIARLNGVWDSAHLLQVGPLLPDTEADCLRIAENAIAKAKGEA